MQNRPTVGGLAESWVLDIGASDVGRELFADAQQIGRCAAFDWDLDADLISFSEYFPALVGRSPGEVGADLGGFLDCVHPQDRSQVEAHLHRTIRSGELPPLRHRVRFPTGQVRTMVLRGRVDVDEAQAPRRLIGFIQDITETVEREQALHESRAALNEAQLLGSLGHFTLQPPGLQLMGSDEFHRLIGTEEGFYVTVHTLPDRFEAEDRPLVRRALERAVRDGQSFDLEARLRGDGRRVRWVRLKARPHRNGARLARLTGIVQDIDHHKQLEAARVQISRVDALSQLAGGLAHDFNNFLTSVLLNLTTLDDDRAQLDASARESVHDAVASARAAQLVTQQLMNFSRGRQPTFERVDLRAMVVEAARFSLRGSSCHLVCDAPEHPVWVRVDPGQIQQVLNNLVLNARQAQDENGTVFVRVGERVEAGTGVRQVDVEVQDQGPGISAEHHDQIFTPYFTTKADGHGLGLASAYSIIKMHRGHLTFECPTGGGTVFRFSIPAVEAPAPAPRTSNSSCLNRGRVLVLDDEIAVRRVLGRALSRLGFEAELTETGHDTIAAWQRAVEAGRPFDFVILDLTVSGGLGGLAVLRALREYSPDVVAVASSGYASGAKLDDDDEGGFAAVLPKPYTFKELERVLTSVAPNSASASQSQRD